MTPPSATIIGGGPAGLMAAETLIHAGVHVDLYDAMPSVGRKLLMAGKGGLNLTHAEPQMLFLARYGARQQQIASMLERFGPGALRAWAHNLGIPTFVGTSRRVFPADFKAAPLLRAWLRRLREAGVRFHVRHRWCGWDGDNTLRFETPQGPHAVRADAVVLALGGGSWAHLGSDAAWVPWLSARGIAITPLRPANCGFDCAWSEFIRDRYAGQALKSVAITFTDIAGTHYHQQGELMITATGLEGSLIYALSAPLRDALEANGNAIIYLDLTPGLSLSKLTESLSRPRGSHTIAKHLRRCAGIDGVKGVLLREKLSAQDYSDPVRLAMLIKALPVTLCAPRPLDEAISTAGGVAFEVLDEHLMVRSMPGLFCAGEMLDWEAPTGGYLLTACFASGHVAGSGAAAWLSRRHRD